MVTSRRIPAYGSDAGVVSYEPLQQRMRRWSDRLHARMHVGRPPVCRFHSRAGYTSRLARRPNDTCVATELPPWTSLHDATADDRRRPAAGAPAPHCTCAADHRRTGHRRRACRRFHRRRDACRACRVEGRRPHRRRSEGQGTHLYVPRLPRHHRLQERLSELPRAAYRRAVGGLPGLGAHRVSRRQAQAPDDAGAGGELLAAGHRRHRRLPFDRERAEVSPTMTIKKTAFAIALLALALTACSKGGEEGHAEGGHAEGEAPKSSSAGLPTGNIEAGMKLATTKRNGFACVDCH